MVNRFRGQVSARYPGKVVKILPRGPYARKEATTAAPAADSGQATARSYEDARAACEKHVSRIIKECRRLNQKSRDLDFDLEWDLKTQTRDCLDGVGGLGRHSADRQPQGVRRVMVRILLTYIARLMIAGYL